MTESAHLADTVRCADCGQTFDMHAVYEVRSPERVIGSVAERRIFWLCSKCWDRLVDAAAFQIARGAL